MLYVKAVLSNSIVPSTVPVQVLPLLSVKVKDVPEMTITLVYPV